MKSAKGKITIRKSGKGFGSLWVYIPSKIVNDLNFPFIDKELVDVELRDGTLKITKSNDLFEIINSYGIENATLPKLLEQKVKENRNRIFLYYKDKTYSYQDINDNSNRLAHGLIELKNLLKIKKGKRPRVSVLLPNCPEFIFSFFGIIKAGCVFSSLDFNLEKDILKSILIKSETEILILEYNFLKKIEEYVRELKKLKKIIVLNAPNGFVFNDMLLDYKTIISKNIENPIIQVENWHQMEILYSSGTTGEPKGIIYRNYMVLTGINVGKEFVEIGLNQGDVIYCPLPLYHGISQILTILPAIFYDASIVIRDEFDPLTFWEDIKNYNATAFIYFGNMLSRLIEHPPSKEDKLHSVNWAFGIGISKDTWKIFEERFRIPLYEGWTLSESVGITINKVGSKGGKLGSVGTSISGYKIKIIDDEGKTLPPGPENIGRIVSKRTMAIPLGYYDDTKWNEEKNGWFHSQDYGYLDEDGYLYFVGRESDMIISKGEQFFAMDVEEALNRHPCIAQSATFGVFNKASGDEDVKVCVVLKKDGIITHEQLLEYLKETLQDFMVPRYIEFRDNLPRTSTTIIQKFKLKQEWENNLSQKFTWDSQIKDFIVKSKI